MIQPVVNVRRPKAIVFDILGTASKSGFLERILFPYLKTNMDAFLDTHWNKKDFVKLYNKIMQQSIEFNKQEQNVPVVSPHNSGDARASFMNFINFVTDNAINASSVTQLRFKIWFEGYQLSKIKTPIYSDVPSKLKQWFAEGIKFYVYSNTWVAAQKALLRNTTHGDLTNLISGHYDNESFGPLSDPSSWKKLCADIRENPNDILFLTKNSLEGRAACEAELAVVLVLTHRHNVKAVPAEDLKRFPYIRTLHELSWLEGAMNPASKADAPQPVSVTGASAATAITTASAEPKYAESSISAANRSKVSRSEKPPATSSVVTATASGTAPSASIPK